MADRKKLKIGLITFAAMSCAAGLMFLSEYRLSRVEPVIPTVATQSDIYGSYEIIAPESTDTEGAKPFINDITVDELADIKGIGRSKAEKIISRRDFLGGFSSFEQIEEISGIGEKTIDILKRYTVIGNESDIFSETSAYSKTETSEHTADFTETAAASTVPMTETDIPVISESETSSTAYSEITTTSETTTVSYTEKAETTDGTVYIDLNTASVKELTKLNGIGSKTAEKIISYREEHGGFSSVDELLNVSGVGEKKFADIKDHIYISVLQTETDALSESESASDAPPQNSSLVNINIASKEELMSLNGIGEVLAQRIIDYRTEHGGFSSASEIKNVKGIGEKTYEKIKDHICV